MNRVLEKIVIVLIAFLFFTIADIVAQPLWLKYHAYDVYFMVWQVTLLGYSVLLGIAWRSILMPLSLLVLAWNGTEDLFFYLLQGQLPPKTLPWLTSWLVIQPATAKTVIFGAIWGFFFLFLASSFKGWRILK